MKSLKNLINVYPVEFREIVLKVVPEEELTLNSFLDNQQEIKKQIEATDRTLFACYFDFMEMAFTR